VSKDAHSWRRGAGGDPNLDDCTAMNEHSIVALLATRGLEDFLQNALIGLTRVGVDPRIIHVARPDNAADSIDPIVAGAGAELHSFTDFDPPSAAAMPNGYADYGTEAFIAINWSKVRYLRWLLQQYDHVVYADVDVGWLADPLWYLQSVARQFPLAFQTEAVRRFPPVFCWGLFAAKRSFVTERLLDSLLAAHARRPPDHPALDEQATCDALIGANLEWLRQIYPLPEGLFLNGLGYRSLIADSAPAATMHGELAPFTFHANWTIGLENKRNLMRRTGTWLLDGQSGLGEAG
jgi:hypothetical protein